MRFLNRTAAADTPRIWGGHLHPFIITSCTWEHGKRARSDRSLLITAINAKREHPSLRRSMWGGTQPSSHPLPIPATNHTVNRDRTRSGSIESFSQFDKTETSGRNPTTSMPTSATRGLLEVVHVRPAHSSNLVFLRPSRAPSTPLAGQGEPHRAMFRRWKHFHPCSRTQGGECLDPNGIDGHAL
jgi:hypothetical protein